MEMLTIAWFLIIGFCVFMYVLLDGMDLGVGILFPLVKKQHDRNIMISTILPVWDGNQTWLVLGGASLYGAFPLAFSLLLPALYLPIFMMVLALLLRGITFEFRLKAEKNIHLWDSLFFLGSIVAAFMQGAILGACVKGFTLAARGTLQYTFFTPFNVVCGVAVACGYALLGASWVIAKTGGRLQEKMFTLAFIALGLTGLFLFIFSVWTPFMDAHIQAIWFNPDYIYKLAVLPLVTGVIFIYCAYCLYRRRDLIIFWLAVGIFLCSYAGVGVSTYPYLVPRVVTVWQAAAPPTSQLFMLFGALLLLPVLLGYTFYAYYIFRGKVTEAIGYH